MNRINLLKKITRQTSISPDHAVRALSATLQALLGSNLPPVQAGGDADPCDSDDGPSGISIFMSIPGPEGDFRISPMSHEGKTCECRRNNEMSIPGPEGDLKKAPLPEDGGQSVRNAEKLLTIVPPPLPNGEALSSYVGQFAGIPQPTAKIVIALVLEAFTQAAVLDR